MPVLREGLVIRGGRSAYRVERMLASGGMGVAWLGLDLGSDEKVVVKEPKPFPVAARKLRFEAQVLRGLRHHNIVRYVDEAMEAGQPLLVEEYVRGVTLKQHVAENGPLPDQEVRARLSAILLALDYLHSRNIVHRDIKPQNIMVGDAYRDTRIIDMGTAIYYNVSGIGELVYSGGGYSAPEQFYSYAFPQSDIWGAMATAFYMATGVEPEKVLRPYYPRSPPPRPPDPRMYNPNISKRLAEAIMKGMAWHVLDRFATAREALDFLNGLGLSGKRGVPRFEVMGVVIHVDAPRLIFGRKPHSAARPGTTVQPGAGGSVVTGLEEEQRVTWTREGDAIVVEVSDPYRWISRRHFEILRYGNGWCIRDLGSTNRTAIVTKRGVFEVWRGRGVPSPCYWLEPRTLILIAYGSSLRNPPYMTAFFSVEG